LARRYKSVTMDSVASEAVAGRFRSSHQESIMRWFLFAPLALILFAGPAPAQAKREPLADRVKTSIDNGVRYLRQVQSAKRSWAVGGDGISNASISHPGGKTALALLALLNAGVPVKDPTVALGFRHLRSIPPETTYVCALQILAYAEAALPEDRQRIQDNVK